MSQPTRWAPANDLEIGLLAAQERHDRPGFLNLLATADLLVPYPPETPGDAFGAIMTEISGRTCMLAFTSEATMHGVLGRDDVPYRRARFVLLDRGWPDRTGTVWLAVDPGRPIEIFLDADALAGVAAIGGQPRDELEEALRRTSEAGDPQGYAQALLDRRVVVPLDPAAGSAAREVNDPNFPWVRLAYEDQPVVVYTSLERLREQLGGVEHVEVPFAEVVAAWADPEQSPPRGRDGPAGLAVNPGTPFDALFGSPLLAHLGGLLQELATATVVQVVVHRDYVDRYLKQNHDRVAGLVHRRPPPGTPLTALYGHLGLLGEGSPFQADDLYGYVVRWSERDPDAYQEPEMEGVTLPAGAGLWRIDQSGDERCLARYTPDSTGGGSWAPA